MKPEIRRRARRRQRLRWFRYNIEYPFRSIVGTIAFPFRHPVLWVFAMRLRLHYWLGLPMPSIPKARIWVSTDGLNWHDFDTSNLPEGLRLSSVELHDGVLVVALYSNDEVGGYLYSTPFEP